MLSGCPVGQFSNDERLTRAHFHPGPDPHPGTPSTVVVLGNISQTATGEVGVEREFFLPQPGFLGFQ